MTTDDARTRRQAPSAIPRGYFNAMERHMNDDTQSTPVAAQDTRGERGERGQWRGRLTDAQKQYVIRRLAAYDRPSRIRRDLREQSGVEISLPGIEQYDPTRSPRCSKESAELFWTVRKAHVGQQSDQAAKSRRVERLVMQTVELIAERILKGVDAEGRAMFAKRPQDITDEDRVDALLAFIDKLKATSPASYAAIRAALNDAPDAA